MADYAQLEITSREQWRTWLAEHHASARGIWVVSYKKRRGEHVPYAELVEEALAYGWIDTRGRALDENRSQLLLTPRRPKSTWSRLNKQRIEVLTAAGLMTAAGQAVVDAAKESGTWTALDDVENLLEPDELRAALDADPAARRHWDAFPRSSKRAILVWIADAKRPDTRGKRVGETARLAAENVRAR